MPQAGALAVAVVGVLLAAPVSAFGFIFYL
jgi:hypothetical protein